MKRDELLLRLKPYFSIEEFVSKPVFDKYGETAWRFFNSDLLETILFIREELGLGITINTWHKGGLFSQRGLRANLSYLVLQASEKKRLYISGHTLGMALDFDVTGMSACEVRNWLVSIAELLPYKIRLENNVNWVHIDVEDEPKNGKVYLFNA